MDEPITFRRDFNMHIKADFKYSFIKGYTASFGGESLRMILIYYNPVLDNQVEWVQGSGQSRLVRVMLDVSCWLLVTTGMDPHSSVCIYVPFPSLYKD